MDQFSKSKASEKFIQKGIGWDGKVYDPADQEAVKKQIETTDVSHGQKLKALQELRTNRTIPQLQPESKTIDRFLKRDKDKPRY